MLSATESTFILALVQSATEFLPVSSSGHLILMEKFGLSQQNLLMDISLHFGTLIAVCAFFARDIIKLLRGLWHKSIEQKIAFALMIATLPACITGYFLNDIIETMFRSPVLIGITSVFYGALLWIVDSRAPRTKNITQISYKDAFYIGLAQALALVPGTSRSGITMTCARFLGYTRVESARFSMLMSIPVIALGALYMFWKSFQQGTLTTDTITQIGIGICLAAFFGLGAIWFLMRWLKKASFGIFAVYRIALGIFLLIFFA